MGSAPGGFGGIGIPARPVGPVTMGGVGSAPASYGGFPAHPVGNGGFNPFGGGMPVSTPSMPGNGMHSFTPQSMPGMASPIQTGLGSSNPYIPAQPVGGQPWGGGSQWGGYGSGFPAQPVGGQPSGMGSMWGGGMPGQAVGPAGYGGSPNLDNLMMLRRMGGY